MVCHEAADQIALGCGAGAVDDTRHKRGDRLAGRRRAACHCQSRRLRSLIVVGGKRSGVAGGRQRQKRRRVNDAWCAERLRDLEGRFEAAYVDLLKRRRIRLPEAHQRRRVIVRIAPHVVLDLGAQVVRHLYRRRVGNASGVLLEVGGQIPAERPAHRSIPGPDRIHGCTSFGDANE